MNVPQNNQNDPSGPQNINDVYDRFAVSENQRMMQSVAGSMNQDPDVYAKAQQLGAQMGVGADIAKRNMEDLMRQQQMNDLQSRNISALNPILARQLSDPEFASIAHDDIPNLLKADEFWQSVPFTGNKFIDYMMPSSIKASIVGGVATAEMQSREYELFQRHRSGDKAAYDEWQKLDAERSKYGSLDRGVIGGFTNVLAQRVYSIPNVIRDATIGATIGATAGAVGGVGVFDWATIPAGAVGGGIAGAGIAMARNAFELESASAYFNNLRSGYDPDAAAYSAYAVGAINAALEMGGLAISSQLTRRAFSTMLRSAIAERAAQTGVKQSLEAIVRPSMMRSIGKAAIEGGKGVFAESAEEVSQDIVQALGHEFARKMSPGDLKSRFSSPGEMGRFARELADTFVQTAESTVLLQVPGMVGHVHNTRTMVNKAKKTAQFYDALAKVSDGKLKVRAPGAAEAFHAAYANRTDAATTYVSASEMEQVLNQANLPTETENELFPGIRAEIEKQKQVDGDINFPTARYAARLAGTPIGEALKQHMRLDPNAPSLAQAIQIEQEQKEMEAAREFEARSILEEKKTTQKAFVESANKVFDRYETELKDAVAATGARITPEQIAQAATAYRDWVVVSAARENMTPEAFEAKNALNVRAEMERIETDLQQSDMAEPADQFDQAGQRRTDTPEFQNWFGDSKVVDAEGKPLVVYHGSQTAGIEEFKTDQGRFERSERGVVWFGNNQRAVSRYANTGNYIDVERVISQLDDSRSSEPRGGVSFLLEDGTYTKPFHTYGNVSEGLTVFYVPEGSVFEAGYYAQKDTSKEAPTKIGETSAEAVSGLRNWLNKQEGMRKPATQRDVTYPVYLRMKNPKTVDFSGKEKTEPWNELVAQAKAEGHDGIIVTNVIDVPRGMFGSIQEPIEQYAGTVYGVFDPKQIKSADNRGTWNPEDANIFNQEAIEDAAEDAKADDVAASDQPPVPVEIDDLAVLDSANKVASSKVWKQGRDLKVELQRRVLEKARAAGIDLSSPSPETIKYLVRVGVRDAMTALKQNPNAVGWYDVKTRQALAVMSLIHPEIATDENAKFAFVWAMAVTSNGLKVDKNFELAEQTYRQYKKTKVMPTDVGIGTAKKAINESLALFNELAAEWGMDDLRKFMQTNYTVGEIAAISKDLKPGGEHVATEVRGSAILGPKIGNGFFSNLYGNFSSLTMDRWLIRTWGRWTGTLIKQQPNQTESARTRLRNAVEALSADQIALLNALLKIDVQSTTADDLAVAIQEASTDKKIRKMLNEIDPTEEFRKSGNGLAKYLDGQKEAPAGPGERTFIRQVFSDMLAELKSQPEYADLTMADLQAALWYAEKRLYESAKEDITEEEVEGYTDEDAPDYANAAVAVARSRKISKSRITEALKKEQDRDRAAAIQSGDEQARYESEGKRAAPAEFSEGEKRIFAGAVATRRARVQRKSSTTGAWSYRSERGRDGARVRVLKNLNVRYIDSWSPGTSLKRVYSANDLVAPTFVELEPSAQSALEFQQRIQQSKDQNRYGAAVYVYPAEDYEKMRLFLSEDGKAGVAVKPDGDIVSVFSMPGSNAGRAVMDLAVAAGGSKLDAFETILPSFYAAHGFKVVSRLKWDDSQAPSNWDKATFGKFNGGEPDVVFMVYDPKSFDMHEQGKTGKVAESYDAAVEMQSTSQKRLAASIRRERQLEQAAKEPTGRRGGYDPMRLVMMLNRESDFSTVLHEMGHHFFSIMSNVAAQENASQQIVADTDTMLKWFGIEGEDAVSRLATWNEMSLDQQRPYHEQFAYNLEIYYFEGRAPSVELQGVFDRFTAWLKRVYKSIATELNDIYKAQFGRDLPFLTDEVRGVMDRMLATDEQIRRAQEIRNMMPILQTKEQAMREGLPESEWAAYQQMDNEATQSAISDLTASSLRQMQYLSNARGRLLRRMQAEHEERRREIRKEVQAEVAELPVYRAMRYFRTGEYKNADGSSAKAPAGYRLSNDGIQDVINRQPGFDSKTLEAVTYIDPEKIPNSITSDEGIHPDAAADMFGFSSGNELLRALTSAKPMNEEIAQRTDARMLSEFGEMLTPDGKEAAIERALHNEARARMTAVELRFAAKAVQPVRAMLEAAKRVAKRAIGDRVVRELRPSEFVAAESRAAVEAARAYRGLPDPETAAKTAAQKAANKATEQGLPADQIMAAAATAAEQARGRAQERNEAFRAKWGSATPEEIVVRSKRSQLLQNQMAREALDAIDEIRSGLKYMRNVLSDNNRKRMGFDTSDQIAAILSKFELRPLTVQELEKTADYDQWALKFRNHGLDPDVPNFVHSQNYRIPYRNLTVSQFRDLVDSIKEMEYLGKNESRALMMAQRQEFKQLRDEMIASIGEKAGGRAVLNRSELTNVGRSITTLKGFAAAHLKAAAIARILDGGEENGPVTRFLIYTANERGNKEATMRAKATEVLMDIMAPVIALGKMGGSGVFFPSINRSLNREACFAIGLNMGNEGNIQRLLDGEGWTMDQIAPVLQSLSSTEWNAIQQIWDFFESYRPEIAAQERDLKGKEPEWVDPKPMSIQASDGSTVTLRGGYYPIRYDPRASLRASTMSDAAQIDELMKPTSVSAVIKESFVKSRAKEVHDRPLLYTMDAVFSGANEVIHSLAWRTWLIDANRLINSDKFIKAVTDAYGVDFAIELKDWVKAVAVGERSVSTGIDKAAAFIRQNVSRGALGFQIMSAISQVTGFANSAVRIGPNAAEGGKWLARGVAAFISNPRESIRMVQDMSEFMRNRNRTQFRELNELKNVVRDQGRFARSWKINTYFLMMQMQRVVDVPTWIAAYEKAKLEHPEDVARKIADQVVIDSQGSGMVKDLSKAERGSEIQKLFTVFYSFMNTVYNQAVVSGYTKSRGQFAADMLMLFVVPVVLGRMLKEALVPGNDDDPEYWKNVARRFRDEQISYLLGTMVMVRELTEAAQVITGGKSFAYTGPAGLRPLVDLQQMAQQAWQGELDRGFRKAAINILGDATGIPSLQINRTLDGIEAMVDGGTVNPMAPLVGVKSPK